MLVDLRPAEVTGKQAETVLDRVGITCNKNSIPFDPQPFTICSGIRLGTPALTTRGMGTGEMTQIAALIKEAISAGDNEAKLASVRKDVRSLAEKFPLYRHRL
jgi:glycine hydroxymethyltransferase